MTPIGCERSVLGVTHPELSAEALAVWNLPAAIQSAVRFHHDVEADNTPAGKDTFRLSRVLRCACDYMQLANIATNDDTNPADAAAIPEPFQPLGIPLAKADFLPAFEDELGLLSGVFQ